MTVTLRCRDKCVICGCRLMGLYVIGVRINKRSLRTTRPGLGAVLPCPECGVERGGRGESLHWPSLWALDHESRARVAAYRAGKGWAA